MKDLATDTAQNEQECVDESSRTAAERNGGLTAQLNEQLAEIQKVSAQIDMSKLAPKVVLNTP